MSAAGPPQGARPPGGERRAAPIGGDHLSAAWRALGALLAYPSADLVAALPEIAAILDRESRLDRARRDGLDALIAWLARTDLLDAQESYVALFDRGRATSLHLFEHVHGDSRARGQAMVELQALYVKAGLTPSANELPDYLPMMLEYLSLRADAEARDMLGDCAHILRAIGGALLDRESRYAAVPAAILALVGEPGLAERADKPPAPTEKALDDEWVDEPVIFGPAAAGGCGASQSLRQPRPQPQPAVVQFMPRRA